MFRMHALLFLLHVMTVTSTLKKGYGLAFDYLQCNDTATLTDASWWYDWKFYADEFPNHHCGNPPTRGEYVPMVWGWWKELNTAINIPADAKYVLGFNEPNQKDQSNLSPQEAAGHWSKIEQHAKGKLLVSPAPSQCSGGPNCNYNPTQWLDAFFNACHGCRVDYLALHAYSCNADADMRYLETMYHRYKKRIWLTEFACPHSSSETHVLNYMKAILYAWFATRWRDDGWLTPAVNLLQQSSSALSSLGQFYNNFRHHVHVTASQKKGFGLNYVNFFCDDTSVLSGASWWYDWKSNNNEFRSHGCSHHSGDYVPMVWGAFNGSTLNIPQAAKYVLGFNEPNQNDQSNLSPEEAARLWPVIEHHANGKQLVSPSPSGCNGGPSCNMNPTAWLDAFFKACHGCKVDYLALHTYSCNAEADMRYLETMYHRYRKPIWLTEFACPHSHSETHILDYMKAMLPRLENAPFVYRYAQSY